MKLKDSTFAIIAEKKDSISHKWFKDNLEKSNLRPSWDIGFVYYYEGGYYNKRYRLSDVKPKDVNIYTESEFEALLKTEEFSEGINVSMITETMKNSEILTEKQINSVLCWMNTWEQLRDTAIPMRFREDFKNKLKAEQENEKFAKVMDRIIAPQVLEMAKFKEENPNATKEEIETKRNELVFRYAHKPAIANNGESANIVYADFKTPISGPKKTVFGKENIAHRHPPLTAKVVNGPKPITKVIKHRYSGKKSQKFWDIVNSIENEADRQELYSLGVMLQNSEEYVLRQLSSLNLCTVTKD